MTRLTKREIGEAIGTVERLALLVIDRTDPEVMDASRHEQLVLDCRWYRHHHRLRADGQAGHELRQLQVARDVVQRELATSHATAVNQRLQRLLDGVRLLLREGW